LENDTQTQHQIDSHKFTITSFDLTKDFACVAKRNIFIEPNKITTKSTQALVSSNKFVALIHNNKVEIMGVLLSTKVSMSIKSRVVSVQFIRKKAFIVTDLSEVCVVDLQTLKSHFVYKSPSMTRSVEPILFPMTLLLRTMSRPITITNSSNFDKATKYMICHYLTDQTVPISIASSSCCISAGIFNHGIAFLFFYGFKSDGFGLTMKVWEVRSSKLNN